MRLPTRPIYTLALLASLAALLAGAAGVYFSAAGEAWMTLAFQVLVLAAGVIGVLTGSGRFRDGPALALLCVAGTLFTGAVLGFVGAGGKVSPGDLARLRPSAFTPGNLPTWILLAQCAAAGACALACALLALSRKPKESWARLFRGVLLALPILAMAGAAVATPLLRWLASVDWIISGPILIVLFLAFVIFASASAHQIINAFAAGLPDYTRAAPPSAEERNAPSPRPARPSST